MRGKPRVLYVSAECEPYCRAGGLGDVSAALPKALLDEGIGVSRVIPRFKSVNCDTRYIMHYPVPMGERYQTCVVEQDLKEIRVPTYFIANDMYFNRDRIYSYGDDGERFLFFCKSVVEMVNRLEFKPDIIHCNDWHSAFIPFLLRAGGYKIKTVFTIHNLRYQGWIPADYINELNIKGHDLEKLGYPEYLNFMKSGIIYSDFITTVSRGYSQEILTPEFGEGMESLLKCKAERLYGIINGIDTEKHNSLRGEDVFLSYDIKSIENKKVNKASLRKELGLKEEDVPLISSITRLDDQKGLDLIVKAVHKMEMKGFQFILLGTGNVYYEEMFRRLSEVYRGKIAVCFSFEPGLAKKIYAGSDIFLMPSRYEPGGLGQLYAMAYGCIPVVRSTGGLKDTVIDMGGNVNMANGICFEDYTVTALINALNRAIHTYGTPIWDRLIKNCMDSDHSWKKPAREYAKLYEEVLEC